MIYKYKNTDVSYTFLNDGSTLLVFLHGWGASSRLMLPLAQKINFSSSFSYLFIDFPPFGQSGEPSEIWDLNDYVNLTYEIIKTIQQEKAFTEFVFIGHSFGGRVAIKLLSEKEEFKSNSKLILLSSAGVKPKFSIRTKIRILKYKFYKNLGSKKAEKFGSNDYKLLSKTMKGTFNKIVNENLTLLCEKITMKTLIVFGDKDKETPLYMGKILNKKIKNSRLIIIKHGTHFTYLYDINQIIPQIETFIS